MVSIPRIFFQVTDDGNGATLANEDRSLSETLLDSYRCGFQPVAVSFDKYRLSTVVNGHFDGATGGTE